MWLAKLYEYLSAVFGYWWVLYPGGLLTLEAIGESFWPRGRQWADRYITQVNRTRLKICIAVLLVFISGFFAWSDENKKWQTEHDSVISLKAKLDILEKAEDSEKRKLNEAISGLQNERTAGQPKQERRIEENIGIIKPMVPAVSHDRDRFCDQKVSFSLAPIQHQPDIFHYTYQLAIHKPHVPLYTFYIISSQDIESINGPGQAFTSQRLPNTAENDRVMEVTFFDPISDGGSFSFSSRAPLTIKCIGRSH